MPGSLPSGFLWSRLRGKRSRRMRNPQRYIFGKRPIWRHWTSTGSSLVRVMTWYLFGAKPLLEAMMVWYEILITNFSEILIKWIHFPKNAWKCRLQNIGHFVQGSMCEKLARWPGAKAGLCNAKGIGSLLVYLVPRYKIDFAVFTLSLSVCWLPCQIQCGAVIRRSIFSKVSTKYTP